MRTIIGSVDISTIPVKNRRFSVLRCSKINDFCLRLAKCQQTLISITFLALSFSAIALEPVQELENLVAPLKTLKAEFKQTVYSEKDKVLQQSAGNLEFKKPNLFRWQVISPDSSLVVTDGHKLWNYDIDLEQVTVQEFSSAQEVSPVSFLFEGADKLSKDFTVTKINTAASPCLKTAKNCFSLQPKLENPNFVAVEVGFDGDKIKVLRLHDHLQQTSVFVFNNVKNNPPLNSSRFSFTPPAGVDVIGEI